MHWMYSTARDCGKVETAGPGQAIQLINKLWFADLNTMYKYSSIPGIYGIIVLVVQISSGFWIIKVSILTSRLDSVIINNLDQKRHKLKLNFRPDSLQFCNNKKKYFKNPNGRFSI